MINSRIVSGLGLSGARIGQVRFGIHQSLTEIPKAFFDVFDAPPQRRHPIVVQDAEGVIFGQVVPLRRQRFDSGSREWVKELAIHLFGEQAGTYTVERHGVNAHSDPAKTIVTISKASAPFESEQPFIPGGGNLLDPAKAFIPKFVEAVEAGRMIPPR